MLDTHSLAASFLFLRYERYTTFEALKREFAAAVDATAKIYPDGRAARFGLRYINIIEVKELPSPTEWHAYIDGTLLGTDAFFKEPDRLTRLMHVAELRYDDISVRFQFGMPNPDYPALMRRPQFVLDLDGYIEIAHDLGESLNYMEQAHERIQALFEGSIRDDLRRRMNVRPAVAVQE